MISDLTNHSLLEIVRCAFYAGPNQALQSWKDWSARAGGRHFPILRLSRSAIILVLWLVMSFGRRWEISCLLWWLFEFTTEILNINSNFCQATLPRCFPPSVQLDRLTKKKNGTNNSPGAKQFWFQIPSKNHPLTTYSQINTWSSSRKHWSKTSSGIYAPTWTKHQRFFKNFKVSNVTFFCELQITICGHISLRLCSSFPSLPRKLDIARTFYRTVVGAVLPSSASPSPHIAEVRQCDTKTKSKMSPSPRIALHCTMVSLSTRMLLWSKFPMYFGQLLQEHIIQN